MDKCKLFVAETRGGSSHLLYGIVTTLEEYHNSNLVSPNQNAKTRERFGEAQTDFSLYRRNGGPLNQQFTMHHVKGFDEYTQ
jgi:hypothetical protein